MFTFDGKASAGLDGAEVQDLVPELKKQKKCRTLSAQNLEKLFKEMEESRCWKDPLTPQKSLTARLVCVCSLENVCLNAHLLRGSTIYDYMIYWQINTQIDPKYRGRSHSGGSKNGHINGPTNQRD